MATIRAGDRRSRREERLVSASDLRRITGLSQNNLDRWVENYQIPAAAGGVRKGRTRMYGFMAVLAMVVGVRLRNSLAPDAWTAGVVRFLARLPRDEFERALGEGRSFPIPGAVFRGGEWVRGLLVRPTEFYSPIDDRAEPEETLKIFQEVDLKAIAADVERAIASCGAGVKAEKRKLNRKQKS